MRLLTSLALLACLLLSGCGFQLRGSANLPPALRQLQLAGLETDSPLYREVQRALRNSRVSVVEDAEYRLGIGREQRSERTISVNANARTGEYELTLDAMFQLSRPGRVVYGPESVSLTRVYLADPENAVAKNEEQELILDEMRRELALLMLRRLQSAELP